MKRNDTITRLTRIFALATALAVATPAVAADSIRVFVVKEKKNGITAPAARDAGFVARAIAKRFGVKAPKGKASVVELDVPPSVWEANKVEIATFAAKRGLSTVVVDDDPKLGSDWAAGYDLEERSTMSLAQEVKVRLYYSGRNIKKLARQVMIDEMRDRVLGAGLRNERGNLGGKPSEDEESSGLRLGDHDIDHGPGGAHFEIDCEEPENSDELVCQLSQGENDSDPEPNDDSNEGVGDDEGFGPRDCDPFVDADCDGGDPCSLGLPDGHPLAGVLGCGFLDAVEDGAIGPRQDGEIDSYDSVTVESVSFNSDDTSCEDTSDGGVACTGSGTVEFESEEGDICQVSCEVIDCTVPREGEGDCSASGCDENPCFE